jgi:hypothetical protein
MHIINFVVGQIVCSGLLKADHILSQRLPWMTIEVCRKVLLILSNIRYLFLTKHIEKY